MSYEARHRVADRRSPMTRAENAEKWIRSGGGSAVVRRSVLDAVARIEAMEATHDTSYLAQPKQREQK